MPWTYKEFKDVVVAEFSLDRAITPEDALRLVAELDTSKIQGKVAIISGRGPIWLYGMILHEIAHIAKAVAFYDPKLNGAVVVASHTPELREGMIIQVKE